MDSNKQQPTPSVAEMPARVRVFWRDGMYRVDMAGWDGGEVVLASAFDEQVALVTSLRAQIAHTHVDRFTPRENLGLRFDMAVEAHDEVLTDLRRYTKENTDLRSQLATAEATAYRKAASCPAYDLEKVNAGDYHHDHAMALDVDGDWVRRADILALIPEVKA